MKQCAGAQSTHPEVPTESPPLTGRVPHAVEARNLAPLPADIDHTMAAALPISGLTAWQALFDHAHLTTGQTVLIHGAAGQSVRSPCSSPVRSEPSSSARAGQQIATPSSAWEHIVSWTCEADKLEDAGEVDVAFDVIGGEILDRSAALVRTGGTLVSTIREAHGPAQGRGRHFFVVEAERSRPGPRTEAQGRTAQADRRGRTATRRSARSVHLRPAHPRQDNHPGNRRRMAVRRGVRVVAYQGMIPAVRRRGRRPR